MLKGLALFLCVALSSGRTVSDDVASFAQFRRTFGRTYSPAEESKRFSCYQSNMDAIDRLNSVGDHALYGPNRFSDVCDDEFKMYHNLKAPSNKTYNYVPRFSTQEVRAAMDTPVDWRTKGAVTPVKDQAQCGSCWSFSATGNMEGQHFLSAGKLLSLSEEELVQCVTKDSGCGGGLMDDAFDFVVANGGIDSESDYPYTSGTGTTGKCKTSKKSSDVAKFSSHVDLQHDEDQMATWLSKNGPIAIAVDASKGWQTYQGGIMSTCTGKQLDHGVLLVGYGTDGSKPYWIVKNSWGASWGENGYIRLARGSDQCAITKLPCSAQV